MTDFDLATVPLDSLVEELESRCIAVVVAMDVPIDGRPDNTELHVCSRGSLTNRLGLSKALSLKMEQEFQLGFMEQYISGEDDEDD